MKLSLILCFIVLYELNLINSEPIRRLNHIGPFPSRYPINAPDPSSQFNENDNYNNYDYDYLNNVSLGRLLQDDTQLIQQTDHLSSQVKTSIASKLMNLANRLQHAANILLDRSVTTSSRRTSHRQKHANRYNRYTTPRPIDERPPVDYEVPDLPSRFNPNNKRNPIGEQSTSPKPSTKPDIDDKNDPKLSPKFPNEDKFESSSKPPFSVLDESAGSVLGRLSFPRNFGPDTVNDDKKEERDDKKRRDLDSLTGLRRLRRDTEERPIFKSVTKRQLLDVSSEVRSGYDSVIRLLKNYLEDPPATNNHNKQNLKRSTQRASEMLENIEQAKKIFISIEDYVSQQFHENNLENRNQTELLTYFDKIIRVEKSRIGQALNEYTNTLATEYAIYEPSSESSSSSTTESSEAAFHDPHVPVPSHRRALEREYQNDDDLNGYVNEHRREIERESVRSHTNYHNQLAREEKLHRENERVIKPTIVVKRTYIPPKTKSRPTRRHPAATDQVRPPYEASINHKETLEKDDDNGYEMIEP